MTPSNGCSTARNRNTHTDEPQPRRTVESRKHNRQKHHKGWQHHRTQTNTNEHIRAQTHTRANIHSHTHTISHAQHTTHNTQHTTHNTHVRVPVNSWQCESGNCKHLKIPIVNAKRFWWHCINHEGFIFGKTPVSMVVSSGQVNVTDMGA